MVTGAQVSAVDPQQAASLLRSNQQNARKARGKYQTAGNVTYLSKPGTFAPLETNAMSAEAGAWDIQRAANTNDAFIKAEENLNTQDGYAAALHRTKLEQQVRGAPLQLPASLSFLENNEDFQESRAEFEEQERALRAESRNRSVETLGPVKQEARRLAQEAGQKMGDAAREEAGKIAARWAAKVGGHGIAIGDAGTSFLDGYVFGAIAFCYDMARGVVTIFVPEERSNNNLGTAEEFTKELAHKTLLMLIPPYHPLREPGDFATFLAELFIATFALSMIFACLVLIITITFKLVGVPLAILNYFPSL